MRYLLTLAALFMVLPLMTIGTTASAGTSCSQNDVNIDGSFGGESFSTPARLDFGEKGNVGLSSQDCVDNDRFDEAKRDARRSAGVAAALDAYGEQPGLNLTLNYANIGLEDDVNAAGVVLGYRHDLANPTWLHSITAKAGFAGDTTGDEMGASIGVTLSLGTF